MKKGFKVSTTIALEYGESGPLVLEAQQMLAKTGSTIKPNGVFSIGMRTAVKAFQRKNGLAVTGIINAATWKKLEACSKPTRRTKKSAK